MDVFAQLSVTTLMSYNDPFDNCALVNLILFLILLRPQFNRKKQQIFSHVDYYVYYNQFVGNLLTIFNYINV
jgi:hypothetical protein